MIKGGILGVMLLRILVREILNSLKVGSIW